MKRITILCLCIALGGAAAAQPVLTLDSCRNMAIRHNKQLQMAAQRMEGAKYEKKAAFTNFFPSVEAAGGYMYNQKNISLLSANQYLPVMNFDGTGYKPSLVTGPDGKPVIGPDGSPIPEQVALIPKEAFEFDIRNVFFGGVTVTQPIYMGGKIMAYNKITRFAEELAKSQHNTAVTEIVFATDEMYWQVVSLVYKKKLAESYVELLRRLNSDVEEMIAEGVATKSDGLTVAVKLNEAEMMLTKVNNGLSLSKMALAQLCGMPVDAQFSLYDERSVPEVRTVEPRVDMEDVYARRSEIASLELASKIYEKKQKIVISSMLPNVAVTGSYLVSNPNSFNGYENKFKGMFNVGVAIRIPILHWGENFYKLKAAKTETRITHLELDEAKEKIELQVNQAVYKMNEAISTRITSEKNMEKAEENLRSAQIGFQEGVLTTTNVLEAQTAWLQAQSEKIDAQIDLRLSEVYLSKALGTMSVRN